MRAFALLMMMLMSLAVGGCLEVEAVDGTLICSTVPNRACPKNYYCAPNNTCWHDGHPFVDKLVRDMAVSPFKPADLSGEDLLSPTD